MKLLRPTHPGRAATAAVRRGRRLRCGVPHRHYKAITFVCGLRLKAYDRAMNAETGSRSCRDSLQDPSRMFPKSAYPLQLRRDWTLLPCMLRTLLRSLARTPFFCRHWKRATSSSWTISTSTKAHGWLKFWRERTAQSDICRPTAPTSTRSRKPIRNSSPLLRKLPERTVAALVAILESCPDLFKPRECQNYFKACGYDTT